MGRVLGIDYGERRIGMAISDPTCTIAQPLPTLVRRRGKRPPYTKIVEIVDEWGAQRVVVGLPLEISGAEGEPASEVREFGDGLERRANVQVEYWDERFTSVQAERELARMELPAMARRQKERVDAMAAMLILQSFLDAQTKD